jgi:hypothetical protein
MMFRSLILMMAASAFLLPAPVAGGLFTRVLSISDQQVERELARFQEEEYVHPEFMQHSATRSLAPACAEGYASTCMVAALFSGEEDIGAYEGCGFLGKETDNFCEDSTYGKICCGDGTDCCELKVGALVGLLIAALALIVLTSCGCCYCCKCCCLVSTILILDPYSSNFCILNIAFVLPSYF